MSTALDARMVRNRGSRLTWVEEWSARTRTSSDVLTRRERAGIDRLMRARRVRTCRGCGVALETTPGQYCSPLCRGR